MKIKFDKSLIAVLAAMLFAFPACTTNSESSDEMHSDAGTAMAEMSEEEMMKAWMDANRKTDHHKWIISHAGEWNAKHTNIAMDGSKSVSDAQSKSWPTLDGRYLQQSYTGDFEGMPFEGMGMFGYDAAAGEYVHVWFDSFSNVPTISRGKPGVDPNVVVTRGTMNMPQGGTVETEMVSKKISHDHHSLDMYMLTPQGRVHNMHIDYTRKP